MTITLRIGERPSRRRLSHAWSGRFQLALEGDRTDGWTIRCGDEVAIECDPSGSTLDCTCRDSAVVGKLREILSRRVLPRLAWLHGRLPVHGASLVQRDGAVLMLGWSGAGKSTLTAAMAAAGWDILSDDMSILSGAEDPHVWQTAPGVSVWEPSRRGLGLPLEACRPIDGYNGKYWYAPPQRRHAAPVPIRAVLFLSSGGAAVDWARVTGPRAAIMAASQMVRFDPGDRGATAKGLECLTRLVAGMPCYTFRQPHSYDMLPSTIDAVSTIYDDATSTSPLRSLAR